MKSKSKHLATYSLIVMGIGFIVTLFLPQNLWVRLLQGGFEAGLVGGFADWFAVTALFRHPLGIPIPHTSLLLENRNKIVNSLISAMESELLNKESISRKLRQMKLFQALSSGTFKWVRKKEVRQVTLTSIASVIEQVPVEKAAPFIQQGIVRYVRNKDVAPLLNWAADEVVEKGYDEKALDQLVIYGSQWARKPETELMLGQLVHGKLQQLQFSGMKGFAVQAFIGFMSEEKLGSMIKNIIISSLQEISYPESEYRIRILREIKTKLKETAGNPNISLQINQWIESKLDDPNTEQWITTKLEELRGRLLAILEKEQRSGGRSLIKGFRWITRTLQSKEELMNRWEQGLLSFIIQMVEANYYRVGQLVRDNLDQLDDQALVQMLEEKIGDDLQWIRVNGAVCGFLIGIVLSIIHLAIS
ncbi:DUF445 domain-containing protein [Paenibacillus pini]|uniref:Membrane protein n=1 Tax=Paenibacillus pini JCM 16418 TaxID=1236976 RepID=W7Y9E2_9BACL|nr:DUF445 domain-containing protein [Paenibacillus pini]GAF07605.1 membrane protein [Paenibacillus pini JCM 16418]